MYDKLVNHDGILQTPWIKTANGDEVCYLISFEPKNVRYIVLQGTGYTLEREEMKRVEIEKALTELRHD